LTISVQTSERLSLDQIRAFLEGSGEVGFKGQKREEVYGWVDQTLRQQRYKELKRSERGLVRKYVEKMTGLSRAQTTRLITIYLGGQEVKARPYRRRRFACRYTGEDIALLASLDEAHETLSGPATRKLLQRACYNFGDQRYRNLAQLSTAHLYRLRATRAYRERRIKYQVTRPTPISIGERRTPDPQGRPGYLRIDTVHQGDRDGVKGVYHINAVDEVTQWEVVGCVEQISEAFLLPMLESMLAQFPFRIRGFHSDNGSEYINHRVAKLLNKLLIEQTKSRPRHSNDNGLAESKNGAVVRKHMGYTHIAAPHAAEIAKFFREHLNAYLNFHRPCGVPEVVVNAKGKQKRVYRWYATPWEILRQLPDVACYLKPETTIAMLDQQAQAKTDTQAAEEMREAKSKLFASFHGNTISQATSRLPLVGGAEIAALRPAKIKTFLEGKPLKFAAAASLPLVGTGVQKLSKKGGPSGG
jgi:transposase InsO family protein